VRVLVLFLLAACATPSPPPPAARGLDIVAAPAEGDVVTLVTQARSRAERQGKRLLVYVGATWCKPCRELHDAVVGGQFADWQPAATLLEFDLDKDKARLAAAGYQGDFVPLLAVPAADGRAGPHLSSGVQKDGDYLTQLRERLGQLLAGS
jgi:thiol-disulfide isomerase/thioredoxin